MAKNRITTTLEAKHQRKVAVKSNHIEENNLMIMEGPLPESQRINCIYDDEPLAFNKDHLTSTMRIHAQDPLKEVDLGNGAIKRPKFISSRIELRMKS